METKRIKISLLAVVILMAIQSSAQKIWDERGGCIDGQGNLAPGYLFGAKTVTAYVDGDLNVFLDDRFAFIGSLWCSFPTRPKDEPGLKANEAVYFGAQYHFLKPSRWDPYIEFTPGIGLVRAAYKDGEGLKLTPFSPAPLAGAAFGCNYYVGSIFHFFVKVQCVTGQMFSTLSSPIRLDEMRFMVGLAFNLRLWTPKKRDTWAKTG